MISLGCTYSDRLCLRCWEVGQSETQIVGKSGPCAAPLILRCSQVNQVLGFTAQCSFHGVTNQKEKTFYTICGNLQRTFFQGFSKSIILTMKTSLVCVKWMVYFGKMKEQKKNERKNERKAVQWLGAWTLEPEWMDS